MQELPHTDNKLVKPLAYKLAEFMDRLGEIDISHSSELALLMYRQEELIQRSSEWDAPTRWKELSDALKDYIRWRDEYDENGQPSALRKRDAAFDTICEISAGGYVYEYLTWGELRSIAEQIRKTKDSEIQRRSKAAEILTEQQVATFISYVINCVMRHVSDDKERRDLLEDLGRISIKV